MTALLEYLDLLLQYIMQHHLPFPGSTAYDIYNK